jgi:hypothetical protein
VADLEPAGFAAFDAARVGDGLIELRQDGARVIKEAPAGVGQFNAPAIAPEKGDAEVFLEVLDLPAERRLGEIQAECGPAEVQFLSDRHEIAELA